MEQCLATSRGEIKFDSFVILGIAQDDSLEQCVTTINYYGLYHEKNWGQNLDQAGQIWAQNYVFCNFLKFGSLVFL